MQRHVIPGTGAAVCLHGRVNGIFRYFVDRFELLVAQLFLDRELVVVDRTCDTACHHRDEQEQSADEAPDARHPTHDLVAQ